jgi:hypothetical protein
VNGFLDGHPKSAIGSSGVTLPARGDMRDHNFVSHEYDKGVQGQFTGATIAPRNYRHVVEQFFGDLGRHLVIGSIIESISALGLLLRAVLRHARARSACRQRVSTEASSRLGPTQ